MFTVGEVKLPCLTEQTSRFWCPPGHFQLANQGLPLRRLDAQQPVDVLGVAAYRLAADARSGLRGGVHVQRPAELRRARPFDLRQHPVDLLQKKSGEGLLK